MKKISLIAFVFTVIVFISFCSKDHSATNTPIINNTITVISGCYGVGTIFKPTNISCGSSGKNWMISADYSNPTGGVSNSSISGWIKIYLPGTSAPTTAGTYSLQANDTLLTAGNACISLQEESDATFCGGLSTSGQLQITIDKGKVHAIFNNVIGAGALKFSGDVTCP